MIPVLATLHLSSRNEGVKGKDGGLSRTALDILALRDWRKVRRYLNGTWPEPLPVSHVYTTDTGRLHAWFEQAHKAPYIVIDTEFNRDTHYLALLGLGFPSMDEALQVEWPHVWSDRREILCRCLKALVARTPVVFQNAVADIPVLEKACGIGYEDYAHIDDTMLAHAVLWSDWPHDLGFLASVYGEYVKLKHLASANSLRYNLGDVVDTISVWEALQAELAGDPKSREVYREQSLPLIPLILGRVQRGIRINVARVAPAALEYTTKKAEAVSLARAYVGWPFNLGSPTQLGMWLYDVEGLPEQRGRQTKRRTADEEAMLKLRSIVGEGVHPLIEARIEYAAAQQVLSHYIKACR